EALLAGRVVEDRGRVLARATGSGQLLRVVDLELRDRVTPRRAATTGRPVLDDPLLDDRADALPGHLLTDLRVRVTGGGEDHGGGADGAVRNGRHGLRATRRGLRGHGRHVRAGRRSGRRRSGRRGGRGRGCRGRLDDRLVLRVVVTQRLGQGRESSGGAGPALALLVDAPNDLVQLADRVDVGLRNVGHIHVRERFGGLTGLCANVGQLVG